MLKVKWHKWLQWAAGIKPWRAMKPASPGRELPSGPCARRSSESQTESYTTGEKLRQREEKAEREGERETQAGRHR